MTTATLSDRRNDISASFRLSASVRTEAAQWTAEGAPGGIATGSAGTQCRARNRAAIPPATDSRANVSKLGRRYRSLAAAQGLFPALRRPRPAGPIDGEGLVTGGSSGPGGRAGSIRRAGWPACPHSRSKNGVASLAHRAPQRLGDGSGAAARHEGAPPPPRRGGAPPRAGGRARGAPPPSPGAGGGGGGPPPPPPPPRPPRRRRP